MKKLLAFTTAAFLMTNPVMAEDTAAKGDGPKHHKGDKMFEKADTDGDGVITKAEFIAEQEKRFAEMDGNGDGQVTKEEAKAKFEEKRAKWKEKHGKKGEQPSADAPAPDAPPAE